MFILYGVYNENSNKIYVGQTVNLIVRLQLRNNKTFKGYTSRLPGEWKLIIKNQFPLAKKLKREK